MGCSIAARMSSRTSTWAVSKWQVHHERYSDDMAEAFLLLQEKCALPEHQLPAVPIRHMRNVLAGSKRKTGLGCDLWPLHLWNYLPDEALRGLQLIVRNMFIRSLCRRSSPSPLSWKRWGEVKDLLVLWLCFFALPCVSTKVLLANGMMLFMAIGIRPFGTHPAFGRPFFEPSRSRSASWKASTALPSSGTSQPSMTQSGSQTLCAWASTPTALGLWALRP